MIRKRNNIYILEESDKSMRVLHISNIGDSVNGLSLIIPQIVNESSKYMEVEWIRNFNNLTELDKAELNMKENFDLIVFHGIYFFKYISLSKELRKENVKYIVIPHGSLTKKAFLRKWYKKIPFSILMYRFLSNANGIQFLSKGELKNSITFESKNCFVIPNGYNGNLSFISHNDVSNGIVGIFIGRKDIYFKGLDILIEACEKEYHLLKEKKCTICIYGPSKKNASEILAEMISKKGLNDIIQIFDSVVDEEKAEVLKNANFFVLTSRSEGLPGALVESFFYSLPTLVTYQTNLGEIIEESNAGIVCDANLDSVRDGLVRMLNVKDFDIYSKNSYKLSEEFQWARIMKKTINVYEEIIGK